MPWDKQVMFPEGIIALQVELMTGLHPRLEENLARLNLQSDDWELKLSSIALYCGVVLDGTYGEEDFNQIGAICAGRLELLRELPAAQKILPLN